MTNKTDEDIIKEFEGEEDLNEERLVGPSDEDDDDPSDTTPTEASELADEGEKLFEEGKRKNITQDTFEN